MVMLGICVVALLIMKSFVIFALNVSNVNLN